MPRYFFNVRHDRGTIHDLEGAEFADLAAVKQEAELSARAMLAEALAKGDVVDGQVFKVTDEQGELVLSYPFRKAVKLPEDAS